MDGLRPCPFCGGAGLHVVDTHTKAGREVGLAAPRGMRDVRGDWPQGDDPAGHRPD